jgi:hypothetical protein
VIQAGTWVTPVAAPAVGVPDLDLVLAGEADAIVELVMCVEADEEAEGGRRDVNRRAMLFADLFDRWRETEGLEEGGTWPVNPVPAPVQDGLEKPIFRVLSVSGERCAPISAIFCR